jgi:hypothetical protein
MICGPEMLRENSAVIEVMFFIFSQLSFYYDICFLCTNVEINVLE